ncbi:hypothetical protein V6N13_066639 [Hibiscus sabdariffa]|uniref:LRAT domain-containing protein n=1 Tax=Hibiscus sabdariffa TaxID=183260 RepID=A0ABR2DR21_9ROSI
MVIHLQGKAKKSKPLPLCQKCGNKRVINGEIAKVCVDCFLDGEKLEIFDYGVPPSEFSARRSGTCSLRHSKPPSEVIRTAVDFLRGESSAAYDWFYNNCEDFAVYCKTGSKGSAQVGEVIGAAGLVACATLLGPVTALGFAGAFVLSKFLRR